MIIDTCACTPYHPHFIQTQNYEHIELMRDIDLFWEVILAQSRVKIFRFSSKKVGRHSYWKNIDKQNFG